MVSTGAVAMIAAGAQVGDFVLTRIGMQRYGVEAEGNPLIRGGMKKLGVTPALTIAKGLMLLMVFDSYKKGQKGGMAFGAGLTYLLGVVPWLIIIAGDDLTAWEPEPPFGA